jgi:hypothetical protein
MRVGNNPQSKSTHGATPVELEVSDIALTPSQRSDTVMQVRPAAHLSQPT